MIDWDDALRVRGTDLYLDSRIPRADSLVSHGHADHLAAHSRAICTAPTAAIGKWRVGLADPVVLAFGERHPFDADTAVTLSPAGHVLGSAMALVERPEGSLLYTGDFKLRPSLTVEPADLPRADYLLMESTYGLPPFRFPPWRSVADELCEIVGNAIRESRQPLVYGYSLGKAQEIVRILTDAGFPVTQHGAVANMSQIYQSFGVPLGRPDQLRRYDAADFHGPAALDLAERGVIVAPPQAAKGAFTTKFDNPLRVMMTGWALQPGAVYRYQVDRCLPLSDHADFDELLETVERVGPRKVFAHHGFAGFVDELRKRGIDATLARPEKQMSLFE